MTNSEEQIAADVERLGLDRIDFSKLPATEVDGVLYLSGIEWKPEVASVIIEHAQYRHEMQAELDRVRKSLSESPNAETSTIGDSFIEELTKWVSV